MDLGLFKIKALWASFSLKLKVLIDNSEKYILADSVLTINGLKRGGGMHARKFQFLDMV